MEKELDDSQEHVLRRGMQKQWFGGLSEPEQDDILREPFEKANPTHEDKMRAKKSYEASQRE